MQMILPHVILPPKKFTAGIIMGFVNPTQRQLCFASLARLKAFIKSTPSSLEYTTYSSFWATKKLFPLRLVLW